MTSSNPLAPVSTAGLVAFTLALGSAPGAIAGPELPPVFDELIGHWRGEGTLMGRPAAFDMEWRSALNGRFVVLQFSNAFAADESAAAVPVLTATEYYRPSSTDPGTADGTWFDTRGVMFPLSVTVTSTALVTLWGDTSTERGRTTYRIVGPDRVDVVDEVVRGEQYELFGQASYTRLPPS